MNKLHLKRTVVSSILALEDSNKDKWLTLDNDDIYSYDIKEGIQKEKCHVKYFQNIYFAWHLLKI